jgi:hypothetical protein
MQEPMSDEECREIRRALEAASDELRKVMKIARAPMAATTDELERMRLGALAQHHADELVRLLLVVAAGWLGLGGAAGMAGMVDRKSAVTAIRNAHFLLPLLDHEPNQMATLKVPD